MSAPDISPEPAVTVMNLISSNWSTDLTSIGYDPEFHTGQYNRDQRLPAITFHSLNEGPVNGGETGITATHGQTGKSMQRLSGYVLVDCVAGTRGHLEGDGENGGDVNPKSFRWQLYHQASQILIDHGPGEGLLSLAPGPGQSLVDEGEEGESAIFLRQFRASYTRDRKPNPD